MDHLGERIKNISSEIKDYVETRLELTVINISERSTWWVGKGIQRMVGFSIFGVGMLFVLFALAIWLGDLLDNTYLGYLIVSAPLLIIGGYFAFTSSHSFAKKIQYEIMDDIINEFENGNSRPKSLAERTEQTEDQKSLEAS
ncbi:phage holin family protein [Balneola sp. MJW-20]|uniref:phage holin family protein n=1 Tax=Gracilimonas aurantiaca TaxID=3234185 RepID=UPI0034661B9B